MNLTRSPRGLLRAAILAVGMLVAGLAFAACGSDDNAASSGATVAPGNGIDRAFVADMIPHHKSAVEMATIAKRRGQSTFVKKLADDITRTQSAEIATMQDIATTLDNAGVKPKSLGIAEHEMGMDMNTAELRTANPFDRAFIDMMVPHHQGAIRMARVELAKGASAKAKKLATQIVAAQTREIKTMNAHRLDAFGSASPAGGVPAQDEKMKHDGASMDHG